MRRTLNLIMIVLFLISCLFWVSGTRAQAAVHELIPTQVNITEFPQVAVRFRPLDANGFPVTDLQLNTFGVRESGQNIAPENLTRVEEGIWVHFVLDAGVWLYGQRWTNAQAAITDYVQTTPWMKENLDHVALTAVTANGRQNLVPFTSDGKELLPALEHFVPPGGTETSRAVRAMDEIVDEMVLLPEATNQAKFIVFVSSGLETGAGSAATALAEKAKASHIPIYVIGLRSDQSQPLEELARESGGLFAQYVRLASLNQLYTQLVAYRDQYDLSYRSSTNQSGTHQVELIANVSEPGHISAITSYNVEINPPRVLIKAPAADTIISRKAEEYTEDRTAIAPTTATVIASVIFPDNHLRRLRQATLLVDGVVAKLLENPNPTSDLELVWDLRNVQQNGLNDFSLEVEVRDELGLVSRSQAVIAKVEVDVPPRPAVQPGETPIDVDALRQEVAEGVRTELERELAVPTIACFDFTPEQLCDRVERPLRRNWISALSITISLVFAGVVWMNREKAPIRAMTETIRRGVDNITKRYRGPAEARAYLIVMDGDVNIGKSLEVFGDTPIGRSKQNSELLFQQHDDNSPISRLHCTIIDEEDHFLIKDEDSANGTFLNGVQLTPLEPEELHDGDEIELGRVERGGVRLRFQTAGLGEDGDVEGDFRQTKQTRRPDDVAQNGSSTAAVEDIF